MPGSGGGLAGLGGVRHGGSGEGIEVAADHRAGTSQQGAGGEVRPGQVPFEGGQIVPAHRRMGGVGVVVQVAVRQPGRGGEQGQGAVVRVQAQAPAGLPVRTSGSNQVCSLIRLSQASWGYISSRGIRTPPITAGHPPMA